MSESIKVAKEKLSLKALIIESFRLYKSNFRLLLTLSLIDCFGTVVLITYNFLFPGAQYALINCGLTGYCHESVVMDLYRAIDNTCQIAGK